MVFHIIAVHDPRIHLPHIDANGLHFAVHAAIPALVRVGGFEHLRAPAIVDPEQIMFALDIGVFRLEDIVAGIVVRREGRWHEKAAVGVHEYGIGEGESIDTTFIAHTDEAHIVPAGIGCFEHRFEAPAAGDGAAVFHHVPIVIDRAAGQVLGEEIAPWQVDAVGRNLEEAVRRPQNGDILVFCGLRFATRAGAQVTTPADGKVEFAGPFRSYGDVVILNPGGGYRLLLAGMDKVTASVGEFLRAGEPVGEMGSGPASVTLFGEVVPDGRPVLYIEFRDGTEAIDSGPWWIGGVKEASG